MTKGDKVIRLVELLKEATALAKETGAISVYYEGHRDDLSVQYSENSFPLPKTLTKATSHSEETDRHFVNISEIELFYLTDKEDTEDATV